MSSKRLLFKTAILKILRPLIRMAIRNQVTHQLFDEWVKCIYIEVAENEFALQNRKPTDSRTSLLTGLTRKDIRHLKNLDQQEINIYEDYHRSTKLISAWHREPEFADENGQPKALALSGENSFESLVKKFGKDVPYRAVLDELIRLKMVEEKDGLYLLKANSFTPETPSSETQLHILGQDVSALVDTIDHNTYQRQFKKRFQRHVHYVGIPKQVIPKLEKLMQEKGQQILEDFDQWLSQHYSEELTEDQKNILIGLYYHESNTNENS